MRKLKRVIIFESGSNGNAAAGYNLPDGQSLAISFSPQGKAELEKIGMDCRWPDEVINLPNLERIGTDNSDRARKICSYLDGKMREKFPSLSGRNINIFSASYYTFKVFLDVLYAAYYVAQAIFEETNVEEVVVFKKPYTLHQVFTGEAAVVPAVMENVFSKKRNIHMVNDGMPDPEVSFRSRLKRQIRSIHNILLNNNPARRRYSNGLVIGDLFDIPYLINDILVGMDFYKMSCEKSSIIFKSIRAPYRKSKKISIDNDKSIHNLILEIFDKTMTDEAYRNIFASDEDLFIFANRCIEEHLLETMNPILSNIDLIEKCVTGLDPKVLITSGCRMDIPDAFLLELARSLGIPIVTYQEGGGAGYMNWPLFNLDAELSDHFLVYGKGVKDSPFIRGKANIVPAGSIRLANLRSEIRVKTNLEPVIYFVPSLFNLSTRQHYPYNGGYFSQIYRHQLKLLEIIEGFKDVKFVVKTLKGREHLYDRGTKHIQIVTRPLTAVLGDASAFIMDLPSTVLQECLLTDKPIGILYRPGSMELGEEALKMLSKRARISSNQTQFPDIIRALVDDVKYGTDMMHDEEFLKAYCLVENPENRLKDFFAEINGGKNGL